MSLPNMQNNLIGGQNMLVNQVPISHSIMTQNNGIVGNAISHGNIGNQIIEQNNMVETQQATALNLGGVQSVPVQNTSMAKTVQQNANILNSNEPLQVLTKQRLQDLVRETDQTVNLEEDVEEVILNYVDEFVDRCLNGAALIAKNRHVNTIEVKDVQQFLNRNYNMWTPGFGTDELRPYKRSLTTEAHKQRTALIRKALKKY